MTRPWTKCGRASLPRDGETWRPHRAYPAGQLAAKVVASALLVSFLVTVDTGIALASSDRTWAESVASPEESACIADTREDWTRQERWVWRQICLGRPAELNEATGFGSGSNKAGPSSWSPQRQLRSTFLESILLDEPYSSRQPVRPVHISGAHFSDLIGLSHSSVPRSVFIEDSQFDLPVDLGGAQMGILGFDRSTFLATLNLNSTQVDGPLDLRGGRFTTVDLGGAVVDGNVEFDGSTLAAELRMSGARISGSLFLRKTFLTSGNLVGTEVSGNVEVDRAVIAGKLDMDTIRIEGALYARCVTARTISLVAAEVSGLVHLDNSKIGDLLALNGSKLGSSLFLVDAMFNEVRIAGADVAGTLSIRGSTIWFLEVRNSTIHKDLQLARNGKELPHWMDGAIIDLRSTKVGAIDDAPDAWPSIVRLAGFTYGEPRGSTTPPAADLASRPLAWYRSWLRRDANRVASQASLYLETVLRDAGRRSVADHLAIDRQRLEGGRLRYGWIGRNLDEYMVGYGYAPLRALIWIVMLVAVGAWVVWRQPVFRTQNSVRSCWLFSIDYTIPVVTFGKATFSRPNVDVDWKFMAPGARWAFYIMKVLGYVLGGFLLAALAKITSV